MPADGPGPAGGLGERPLVLWSGTVWGATYEERFDAAVAGGFSSVTMFPSDYRAARRAGLRDADMRALAADRGVHVSTLDPYARWLPRWQPRAGTRPEHVEFLATEEDELLAMADALRVGAISVVEPFGCEYHIDELVESFAALCDRMVARGLAVQLEFIPFTGIRDLARAWDIVRLAERPNGGLVLDFWHYLRGRRDDDLLARIPGERILAVQVTDAPAAPVGAAVEDSLRRRRLPGEGDLDVECLLARLVQKDGLGPIGLEVFDDDLRRRPPREIGRRGGAALRRALRAAERLAWEEAGVGAARTHDPPGASSGR